MAAIRTTPGAPAERIGRLGFRKWYERELLSGHAYMVLAILSTVALMASMETARDGGLIRAQNVAFVVLSAGIGLWAIRRYLFLTMRAEVVANQANCPDCGEYGRFGVVGADATGSEAEVCCRKCTRKWLIDTTS